MNTTNMYWHVHHDVLVEWCNNYEERAKHIRSTKPKNEQNIRFGLFKPVKGILPREVVMVGQLQDQSRQFYDQIWQAVFLARYDLDAQPDDDQKKNNFRQTMRAGGRAGSIYDLVTKLYLQVLKNNEQDILKLHEFECPNCPWNGQRIIFP